MTLEQWRALPGVRMDRETFRGLPVEPERTWDNTYFMMKVDGRWCVCRHVRFSLYTKLEISRAVVRVR